MFTDDMEHRTGPETDDFELDDSFFEDLLNYGSLQIDDSEDYQFDLDSVISEWDEQLNIDTDTPRVENESSIISAYIPEQPVPDEIRIDDGTVKEPLSAKDLMKWIRSVFGSLQSSHFFRTFQRTMDLQRTTSMRGFAGLL